MEDSLDTSEKLLQEESQRQNAASLLCCRTMTNATADVYSDDIIVDGRDQIILSDASGEIKMLRSMAQGPVRVSKILTTTSFLVFKCEKRNSSSNSESGERGERSFSKKDVGDKILLRLDLKDLIGAKGFITTDSSGKSTYSMKVFEYRKFISSGCGSTSNYRTRTEYSFSFPTEASCYAWTSSILNILHARGDPSLQYSIKNIVGDKGRARTSTEDLVKIVANASIGAGGSSEGNTTPPNTDSEQGAANNTNNSNNSNSPNNDNHSMYNSSNSISSIGYLRKYLVILNPVSGPGQSLSLFEDIVRPMFEEAAIEVELLITKHANHATEYVQNEHTDLSQFDAIVTMGGDGIIYEVINGIVNRGGKGQGLKLLQMLPLAILPGGTGNGLAKSALYASNDENYSVLNAAFLAIKGEPAALDLSQYETASGVTHTSFLSLGWGLISDVDIMSESMRYLGEARLYAAAVYFIAMKHKYQVRISMNLTKPKPGVDDKVDDDGGLESGLVTESLPDISRDFFDGNSTPEEKKNQLVLEGEFQLIWVVQTSHAAATMHSGPGVELDDGVFTVYVVRDMSRFELLQLLIDIDTGDHAGRENVEVYKASSYRIDPFVHPEGGEERNSMLSLDGELVEYGTIQAKVLPKAARILKLPNFK